jgi:hypothetical protein
MMEIYKYIYEHTIERVGITIIKFECRLQLHITGNKYIKCMNTKLRKRENIK